MGKSTVAASDTGLRPLLWPFDSPMADPPGLRVSGIRSGLVNDSAELCDRLPFMVAVELAGELMVGVD